MKSRIVLLILLLMMVIQPGYGQNTSKKALRLKAKIVKDHYIDSLINTKTFEFVANRALPQGWESVDLTTNHNFLKFDPELIESYMPYFGRAYSVDYGGDGGIKFGAKPLEYNIAKAKNGKGYEVNVTVSDIKDVYKLSLFVSPDGNATLNINCNQKSSISYMGEVGKVEKPVEK
ncbi:MAG: DUF4251 domain-containing protein [Mariniphaga sp.]